jgi:hypothetical protein
MLSDRRSRLLDTQSLDTQSLDTLIAGIATVEAFAKSFTPFYLIGSTAIFGFANASASALTAIFVILLAQRPLKTSPAPAKRQCITF